MCFFTINQHNSGSVGLGILVLKLALIVGLITAVIYASLNSTEESSLILRLLKPIIVDGKKAILSLITDPNFYRPFLIVTLVASVLVLLVFGMTTLRNYIGPRRRNNRPIVGKPRKNKRTVERSATTSPLLTPDKVPLNYPRNNLYPNITSTPQHNFTQNSNTLFKPIEIC